MKTNKLKSQRNNIFFIGKILFIFIGLIFGIIAGHIACHETKNYTYGIIIGCFVTSLLSGPIFFLLDACIKDDEIDSD